VGRVMGSIYLAKVLLACPFCREMFDRRERRSCPVCGVPLVPLEKLAPATAAALGDDDEELWEAPEHRPLPWTYLGRGRAFLAILAVVGLGVFFLPWVRLTMPEWVDYSGFALARRLGWTWGPAVAWFVLLPTVLTRRSIMQMRGARVAAAFLCAVPGITAAILLLRPPHGVHGVPLRFTFGAGLYASLALSITGVLVGAVFGGRIDDIRLERGSSAGKLVH
jgi:hypothetical protein